MRQTDMTKLIIAFRDCANMPKKGTDSSFLRETIPTQDGQALVSGKNTI